MTRFGWLVVIGILVAVLGIALLLWGFSRQSSLPIVAEDENKGEVDPATLSIYTNGVYGFSVLYPATSVITDAFTEENSIPWRLNTSATGSPIVRIETPQAEVRIGASSDSRALSSCEEATASEQEMEPLTIGSTVWQVFVFDELGTENERRVTSYRTLHEDQCFALETFTSLSGTSAADVDFIARNFTFAR